LIKFGEVFAVDKKTQPLLEVKKVTKFFGSLVALHEVSLDVYPGEIVAVIGPNGAGKTTLFNVIAGILSPTKGEVWFEGQEITKLRTHEISRLGIGSTFQDFRLFNNMAGFENAMLGAWRFSRVGLFGCMLGLPKAKRDDDTIAHGMLRRLALLGILDKRLVPPPSTMTLRDQRALTIGRALGGEPKLLLLDEPAAGLNYEEIKELGQHFLRYREQGMAMLLIDHRMEIVMSISDRIVVLNFGRKIAEGTPAEIQDDREVLAVYLGEKAFKLP
jgi:branched-chain amino acid transport system ATP-binding protein